MSTNSNVLSQGGIGNNFEIALHTTYFISFILGSHIPGIEDGRIREFRQQSGSLGYQTDDLLLKCDRRTGSSRVLIQAKHLITITGTNPMFQKVIKDAWKDFRNTSLFNPATDKIFLVSAAWPVSVKTHLVQLLEWAKSKDSTADFDNEVCRINAKKQYYDHFSTVIRSEEPAAKAEDLHAFFRCFEILEYDLDKEASIIKANMLSLLELSKQPGSESAENIWNEVFQKMAAKNASGGLTLEATLSDYKAKLHPAHLRDIQKELRRLSEESMHILKIQSDYIGTKHLPREELIATGLEKLSNGQILLITGDPGTGKSALSKNLLELLQRDQNGYIIAIKADELGSGQLRKWFRESGFQFAISEIFSLFPLQPNSIIYIDAFEKLLEGADTAFIQLLDALSSMPNVKLVISCRKSLLSTLHLRFFTEVTYDELYIPLLSDEELSQIASALPMLTTAIDNPEIRKLVRIPKYLDFIYKAANSGFTDYSLMNEADLQARLWEAIVENKIEEMKGGLPQRRRETFIKVAVSRSRKMQPFTGLENADPEAVEKLLKDNVIIQAKNQPHYSPSHDVLEDWALIKYVDQLFEQNPDDEELFKALGTAPAMRRAYRLWIADAIGQRSEGKIASFTRSLSNTNIQNYWRHACLIAVLNSPYCDRFVTENQTVLLANDWKLFFEVTQVMRTTGRARMEYEGKPILIPTGYGWVPVLGIMNQRLHQINPVHYPKMLAIVAEWSTIVEITEMLPEGIQKAGNIMLFLFEHYVIKTDRQYGKERWMDANIIMLYKLAGGIVPILQTWLEALAEGKEHTEKVSTILVKYRDQFIRIALSGFPSKQLAKHLPDPLLKLARSRWYLRPKSADIPDQTGIVAFLIENYDDYSLEIEGKFGLYNDLRLDYSNPSALGTPTLWLLKFHPKKMVDFIIELINHSTDHYAKSKFSKRDEVISIHLEIPDGPIVTQIGSDALWLLYRGSGTPMPYLLQSVMMALEKYLYELASEGKDQELLLACMWKLYRQSTSVATTAVISSIVQAFPATTENLLLPLVGHRAIFNWEATRYSNDFQEPILVLANLEIIEERWQSQKLPHRLKYHCGLRSFLVDYCYNIGHYNKEIFSLIDKMRSKADFSDLNWAQLLDDIDVRVWEVKEEGISEGRHYCNLGPAYRPEIVELAKRNEQEIANRNQASKYIVLLRKAQEANAIVPYEQWREIFEYYTSLPEMNVLQHAPGLLAYHGLENWQLLSRDEQSWVASALFNMAENISLRPPGHGLFLGDFHLYDCEAVLVILPRVLDIEDLDLDERAQVLKLIARIAIRHMNEKDSIYRHFLKGFHIHFWKKHSEDALRIWQGAIHFAEYLRTVPEVKYESAEQYSAARYEQLDKYIELVLTEQISIQLSQIKLERYQNWSLLNSIDLIDEHEPVALTKSYLLTMLNLYFAYDEKKDIKADRRGYDDSIRKLKTKLVNKFSSIILTSASGCGLDLLEQCSAFVYDLVKKHDVANGDVPFESFYTELAKNMIMETDQRILKDPANNTTHAENFRRVWRKMAVINNQLPYRVYLFNLFLDIEWKKEAKEWAPLEGMNEFYRILTKVYGGHLYVQIINLLATIGDKNLLPGTFLELVSQLQLKPREEYRLYGDTMAEQLAMRLYNRHLNALRKTKEDFDRYIWFLETLIEEGSTEAFWIMEFVITFKGYPTVTSSD